MPTLNKVQVSYDTETAFCVPPVRRWEHRIGVYSFAEQQVLREWYKAQADDKSQQSAGRLTDSLRAYWLGQAQAYESEHRFLIAIDAYRTALELASDEAVGVRLESLINRHLEVNRLFVEAISQSDQRQYVEAAATLEKVLAIKPNEALAHGKLGALYATLGDKARATEHLQAVAKYDPNSPYGFGMLGWMAYLDNRPAEAIRQYRLADEVEPYNAKIHYQMGLAFAQQGDLSSAVDNLRQSLAIEPNQVAGIVALSRALIGQGQTEEGYEFAQRAVQRTGAQDADSLLALAYASAAVGRLVEAEGAARQALALTTSTNPGMAAEIRAALDEFRARSGRQK
jgi:tetratricopeptide (TPR) repeat protein